MNALLSLFFSLSALSLFVGAAIAGESSRIVQTTTDDYRLNAPSCRLVLDVNPKVGGRITRLQFDDQDIIRPYSCDSTHYMPRSPCNGSGSTFWTSPQRAWPNGGWPPVESVDGAAFSASIRNNHLQLMGPVNEALGASVDKDIAIDEARCVINLQYTIHASHVLNAAPWEITRVTRGGLAVFPLGDKSKLSDAPLQPFVKVANDDIAWFDDLQHGAKPSKGGEKLIADGREGWLAYALHDKLFIKAFKDVPVELLAPNEGDIEIYADGEFLELEQQGDYTSIAADGSLSWPVQWRVIAIPKSVKIETGSESLLKLIRDEVAKLR